MKRYTQKQIEEAQKLYETTSKTNQEIGDELNIPKGTIQMWTKRYNWKRNKELIKQFLDNKNNRCKKIIKDDNYYKAKDLYENTILSVPDISKQTNLTIDQIHRRIKEHNWYRSEEQISEMFSKKNKERYQNYTEEEKQNIKQKMSETNKKVWANRSEEKKQEIIQHRLETINNKSEKDILETNKKISGGVKRTWNNKSEEEKQLIIEHQKQVWDNKSEEEIKEFSNKMKNVWLDSSEEYKNKFIEKHKTTWKNKTEEEKQLHSKNVSMGLKNLSKERKIEIRNKVKETWRTMSEEKRIEISNKISKALNNRSQEDIINSVKQRRTTMHKNNSFRAVANDGTKLDSKYEVAVYEFCKRNHIPMKTQIPIEYTYNNELHITYIDFEIDGILFECKGGHLLKGIYDYALPVPIEKKLEVYRENNVVLITDDIGSEIIPNSNSKYSNGLKYLDKCPNPLIGVDINLFIEPEFPYAIDKPKCFYKVKVDGKLSAIEAWNNELIRWKMIKNRINYVGGYINNKSILTAMNVTRTCKQPSWFDKNYAKQLIEKYITTNTILDPFAGWGTRCDACKDLGNINYYGWDLNKELVEWHHQLNRTFDTGCGIEYDDANNIKTVRENCSIFICPPYTDFEVYFDGQDTKTTQCEWLLKVMKNIPNAKEYLMVCKVVDPGWEQFIVEEKINKSHLGTNKEYVIYINSNQSKILTGK